MRKGDNLYYATRDERVVYDFLKNSLVFPQLFYRLVYTLFDLVIGTFRINTLHLQKKKGKCHSDGLEDVVIVSFLNLISWVDVYIFLKIG